MTPAELGEIAGAIREHLWRPAMPTFHGERKPWSMGRELSIAKILVRSGVQPQQLVGAISVVRTLRTDWQGRPLSLRCFYWRRGDSFCATPFLEACIGYHLKRCEREQTDNGRAWTDKSVQQTLRRMIGA